MKVDFYKLKEKDIIAYNLVKASWLQKAVRRGLVNTAVSLAQTYIDEGQEKALYKKLLVFCAEDIGTGTPQAIQMIDKIDNPLHQTEFLCRIIKNRETDRFLLATRDCYEDLVQNKELEVEVKTLNILIKIAGRWFDNKRKKQNLIDLENAYEMLKSKTSTDEQKALLDTLLEKYIFLSKGKAFGTRTLLALSVLIAVRDIQLEEVNEPEYTGVLESLQWVDDFALDKHTSYGKELNRGIEHWVKEGSPVYPEKDYPELYLSNGEEKYPYSLLTKTKLSSN